MIARRLGISVHTAKFHVASLLTSSTRLDVPMPSPTRRGVVSLTCDHKLSSFHVPVASQAGSRASRKCAASNGSIIEPGTSVI